MSRAERIVCTRLSDTATANDGYGESRVAFLDPDGSGLSVIDGLWATHPRERH